MKGKYSVSILFALILFLSCADRTDSNREAERRALDQEFARIEQIALQADCTDSTEWSYTPIGAKACGGPQAYIPYSTANSVDSALIIQWVRNYTSNEEAYNQRWDITSDCDVPPEPSGVTCSNGRAYLVYP